MKYYFILFFILTPFFLFSQQAKVYELKYIQAQSVFDALSNELKRGPVRIASFNRLAFSGTAQQQQEIESHITLLDTPSLAHSIQLKYLQSSELSTFLPPTINENEIIFTANPNLIFFIGSNEKYALLQKHLSLIDTIKPQIRYQMLVVQYQKGNDFNWAKSLSMSKNKKDEPMHTFSGVMNNLFNLNFDIVTKFGYQFAAKLNFEMANNTARVLADTTLNGLSGESVKFQNTNTFRYVDAVIDPNTGKPVYGGQAREITSGLLVNIKGVISGENMITMEVNAQVSKQGTAGTGKALPPTSEKIVTTKVRTPSAHPIIIGGLLQVEESEIIKKVPGLGDIPVAGYLFKDITTNETITEMVIYIIPYLHNNPENQTPEKQIERLYKKYFAKN